MKAVVWSERRRKAGPRHGEHRLTNRQIEMRLQKPFFFPGLPHRDGDHDGSWRTSSVTRTGSRRRIEAGHGGAARRREQCNWTTESEFSLWGENRQEKSPHGDDNTTFAADECGLAV